MPFPLDVNISLDLSSYVQSDLSEPVPATVTLFPCLLGLQEPPVQIGFVHTFHSNFSCVAAATVLSPMRPGHRITINKSTAASLISVPVNSLIWFWLIVSLLDLKQGSICV